MAIQALIDTLEEMNAQHTLMLELGERKKQAIIQNDVDELTRIVNKETKFVKHIEELDQVRQQAVYEFLHEKGIKSNLNLNITELLRMVFHPEEKRRLMDVQQKFTQTLTELKHLNTLNQQMIEQSLTIVNYSLDLVTGGPEDEVIYQHPGHPGYSPKRKGMFDSRI
ncbi:flagellar biosynthesis protein FlgN [Paenibacillus selenitireducens]|uniref:Flagellar biosynthesis protein FlgN n=1 Tax=Paenibacillus selenitireducens TaxID=1324314 RepID=A0A1T2X7V3_9BACL|nr:flagellar protein FlgN [Paenibacillus selenitireducens]OPA75663.1 flagellar biosynthesis protein FlgN [Paenibacillus selenitireducens]